MVKVTLEFEAEATEDKDNLIIQIPSFEKAKFTLVEDSILV